MGGLTNSSGTVPNQAVAAALRLHLGRGAGRAAECTARSHRGGGQQLQLRTSNDRSGRSTLAPAWKSLSVRAEKRHAASSRAAAECAEHRACIAALPRSGICRNRAPNYAARTSGAPSRRLRLVFRSIPVHRVHATRSTSLAPTQCPIKLERRALNCSCELADVPRLNLAAGAYSPHSASAANETRDVSRAPHKQLTCDRRRPGASRLLRRESPTLSSLTISLGANRSTSTALIAPKHSSREASCVACNASAHTAQPEPSWRRCGKHARYQRSRDTARGRNGFV